MIYKAQLVARRFSQRLGIDYGKRYSPVVDAILLRGSVLDCNQIGM